MGLLDSLKKALGREPVESPAPQASAGATRHEPAPEEDPRVPEVTPQELMAEMGRDAAGPILLLDCREHYERAQAFVPGSLHIPMNTIPMRLGELDHGQDIVVYCAHGNRSYGVAGWLIQQGYTARSLKGGIVDWQRGGGMVESSYRRQA